MAVTDRPMFAPRVAPRDRQSGAVGGAGITGIYSDPSGAIMRPVRPPLFPANPARTAVEEANFEPVFLYPGTPSGVVVLYDRATGRVRSKEGERLPPYLEEAYSRDLQRQEGIAAETELRDLTQEEQRLLEGSVSAMRGGDAPFGVTLAQEAGRTRQGIPAARAAAEEAANLPSVNVIQDRGILDVEGPESISPATLDIFNNLGRAAQSAVPEAPVRPTGPSDMEQGARRTPAEAARAALGLSGMEEEARGRRTATTVSGMGRDASAGPLVTNPTEVAAGLNDPNKAVREKTAADFAKEFMDMAPKYEGTPKHLLLAQIGFAIAAGESPNAMQNIADGLLAGSEAFVRDNAAKSEFDRQLKLSAMQYGLQELGKERERGRPALRYVALTDTTYKGRDIPKGGTVLLSLKDIEDNGGIVPAGFGEPEVYTALAEKEAAVHTMLQDEYDRGVIDDETLLKQAQNYTELATRVAQTQRALDYFEQALFTVGEDGNLTGAPGALRSLVSKAASFAGVPMSEVDALAEAGKAQELTELLTRGVISSVPVVLEGQSANSISNFDVENAIKGLVSSAISEGSMTRALTNETALIRQIQDSMRTIEGARQRAFAGMSYIEKHLTNRFTKAGDYYAPAPAIDVLEPIRQSVGLGQEPIGSSTFGDIVVGENGVWKLVLPGS